MTRVRALPERASCEIRFPRIVGYRFELDGERLAWRFDDESRFVLSTKDVPTETEVAGVVGEREIHDLDDLRSQREQAVLFTLARELAARHFSDRPWLFPQLVEAAREWLRTSVELHDHTFPQLLLLHQRRSAAVERIARGLVSTERGEARLVAVPAPYEPEVDAKERTYLPDSSSESTTATATTTCSTSWSR